MMIFAVERKFVSSYLIGSQGRQHRVSDLPLSSSHTAAAAAVATAATYYQIVGRSLNLL